MTLPGINVANYDIVNDPNFIDAVRLHGPSRPNVGSVGALKNAQTVKRRFVKTAAQTPPGTAELRQGDDELFVKYRGLPGWGSVDSDGHFAELALIAPDASGNYHAWTIEHMRHPVETSQTSVFKFDFDPDIWTTAFNSKTHSPFKGTGYQPPDNALCGLCITGLAGAIRTNILPFRFPGGGGGGPVQPLAWLPEIGVVGPQLAMSADPANLARWSNEQLDAWANDLLVEHGFHGVDLWLLGQDINSSTVRLLSHPACRIARVIMWTDTDRGGPTEFDTPETRAYLQRIINTTQNIDVKLVIEPSFDLNELSESRRKVQEFVNLGRAMKPASSVATYLFGGRQHESVQPLPGDYADWGDHVNDKSQWESLCIQTVRRASGKLAGQTDRFRNRSGSTRTKDWDLDQFPDGVRIAKDYLMASWGYLPDGNHEIGSRPFPEPIKSQISEALNSEGGGNGMGVRPDELTQLGLRIAPEDTVGVLNDRISFEVPRAMEVQRIKFWIGCWPEVLNEAAMGVHVNKRNLGEFSIHKHYEFVEAASGFMWAHAGMGGSYVDHGWVYLLEPVEIRPGDELELSYNQHPESADRGTHFSAVLYGRKVD